MANGKNEGFWARLAIVGPTASGKSTLATELARRRPPVELLSMDAMARVSGAWTSVPAPRPPRRRPRCVTTASTWWTPRATIPWVRIWRPCARWSTTHVVRGTSLVAVGGTGLYARAVVDDPGDSRHLSRRSRRAGGGAGHGGSLRGGCGRCDPLAASRTGAANRRRIIRALEVTVGSGRRFSSYGQGPPITTGRPCSRRSGCGCPAGCWMRASPSAIESSSTPASLDEVRRLRDAPTPLSRTARQALGYRELFDHLDGRCNLAEADRGGSAAHPPVRPTPGTLVPP